jgi:fructose-bisphosphate aldolase class 1
LLFTTDNALATNVSGVILFHETVYQKAADGTPFIEVLKKKGIIPGIKVDSGVVDLMASEGEQIDLEITSEVLLKFLLSSIFRRMHNSRSVIFGSAAEASFHGFAGSFIVIKKYVHESRHDLLRVKAESCAFEY